MEPMNAYLDYNSTTPLDPEAFEAMRPFLTENFGNASSFHQKGQNARHAVESAREMLADYLEVEPGDIIFTSGGTEADNLAVKGTLEWLRDKRRHLVVSAIEHQAVLHPAQYLATQGISVSIVPVDSYGIIDLNALEKEVTDKTALVSVMHVNNEVGTIQPIKEAARIAHDKGALFHTDAVQSLGKIKFNPEELGVDMASMSGHKIYGPKGVGALFVKKGLKIKSMVHGGHQEKNVRPGTENVAAIAGFGKAVELLIKNQDTESKRVAVLRNLLHDGLSRKIPGLRLNRSEERRVGKECRSR